MTKRVFVGKIDLDTIGCAFLLGISREDAVEVLRSAQATPEDLADPNVICIEVGGSGRVDLSDFDHHEVGGPTRSATYQAWEHVGRPEELARLVEYIDILDTAGPQALGTEKRPPGEGDNTPRRFLSDVLAGMFLTERNPLEQLHKGIEILKEIAEKGYDPFGEIPGFDAYVKTKAENVRQVVLAVENARWETSQGGLQVAILETQFPGATGALYGAGAQVAVLLNPNFNGVRKFTIGGNNGIRVDAVLPALNQLEAGWGGPATGTILGSHREGSNLSLDEVARVVLETL